jgi:hypothetical protein
MRLFYACFLVFPLVLYGQATPQKDAKASLNYGTVVLHLDLTNEEPDRVHFTFSGKKDVFVNSYGSQANDVLGRLFRVGDPVGASLVLTDSNGFEGTVRLGDTLAYSIVRFLGTTLSIETESFPLPLRQDKSSFTVTVPVRFDGEIAGCPLQPPADMFSQCQEQYTPFILKLHGKGTAVVHFFWYADDFFSVNEVDYIMS